MKTMPSPLPSSLLLPGEIENENSVEKEVGFFASRNLNGSVRMRSPVLEVDGRVSSTQGGPLSTLINQASPKRAVSESKLGLFGRVRVNEREEEGFEIRNRA
ncbi:hypothetical protein F2P56_028519 [Juglans regia]|uniref:Uncharacterized protein n=1 Tax=Juglans regia TaxID=51240 RepID=A0A833U9X1_JUGRE|nr:hypothetical protein F2P56_028519 [Juglans regia]